MCFIRTINHTTKDLQHRLLIVQIWFVRCLLIWSELEKNGLGKEGSITTQEETEEQYQSTYVCRLAGTIVADMLQ